MKQNEIHNNESYLAHWLAGDLTDDQLKTLVSETDFIAYKKLQKGIAAFDVLEAPLDNTLNQINKTIDTKRNQKKRPNYWTIAIAASIVLFLGLYTFFDSNNFTSQTGIGQQETLVLLDGSEVQLNAKSTLSYDASNWEDARTLSLNGEAYFKVTKGQTFTVNTNNGSVTVLGTQFNVISHDNYFEVTCYEGKVRVTSNSKEHILTPGKSVRLVNGNLETMTLEDDSPTWIHGESTFKSVPLKHVIEALEAQYNVNIDASNIDKETIFTGTFTHDSLKLALRTTFDPLKIKYTNEKERIIKLSAN
jgi:ferric-dicitrate binding protein FerR (iron transport regulator)